MDLSYLSPLSTFLAGMFLIGCASTSPPAPVRETAECMRYRSMMTAPMPPEVHRRLQQACEASSKTQARGN